MCFKKELLTNNGLSDEYHGVQKAENIGYASVTSQANLAVGNIDLDRESADVLEYDSPSKEGLQGEQILLCNYPVMYGDDEQECTYQISEKKDMKEDADDTVITVSESVVTVPKLQIAFPSNKAKN